MSVIKVHCIYHPYFDIPVYIGKKPVRRMVNRCPNKRHHRTGVIFSCILHKCVTHFLCTVSCSRLGLTSLAYLWRRDQKDLLDEMIQCDVKAILIKVATLGNCK